MSLNPIVRHLFSGNPRLIVIGDVIISTDRLIPDNNLITISDPDIDMNIIKVGQYVWGYANNPNSDLFVTWAKIISVDIANKNFTVDKWSNGIPDNSIGNITINGWVCDLPKPEKMTEKFYPEYLIHNFIDKHKETIFFGWNYECVLDYSTNVYADFLIELQRQINYSKNSRLIFIPRDNKRQYNVIYSDNIELTKTRSGYSGFQIRLIGKELIQNIISYTGYGSNYATNYGICL